MNGSWDSRSTEPMESYYTMESYYRRYTGNDQHTQADRQTGRQADEQTSRQADRQTRLRVRRDKADKTAKEFLI
jgi:hypothetical protein